MCHRSPFPKTVLDKTHGGSGEKSSFAAYLAVVFLLTSSLSEISRWEYPSALISLIRSRVAMGMVMSSLLPPAARLWKVRSRRRGTLLSWRAWRADSFRHHNPDPSHHPSPALPTRAPDSAPVSRPDQCVAHFFVTEAAQLLVSQNMQSAPWVAYVTWHLFAARGKNLQAAPRAVLRVSLITGRSHRSSVAQDDLLQPMC